MLKGKLLSHINSKLQRIGHIRNMKKLFQLNSSPVCAQLQKLSSESLISRIKSPLLLAIKKQCPHVWRLQVATHRQAFSCSKHRLHFCSLRLEAASHESSFVATAMIMTQVLQLKDRNTARCISRRCTLWLLHLH